MAFPDGSADAGPGGSRVGFTLAYGYEPHTTAVHLERALERQPDILLREAGAASPVAGGQEPLLWVESGVEWIPSVEQLSEHTSGAWLIDTHRGMGWRTTVATAFDVAFVAQFDAVEPIRARGVRCEWLPLAAPRELCGPGPELADRSYDVAFIGQCPPGSLRAAVLDALRSHFSMAPVTGFVPPDQMMERYRSARVVVNLPWAGDLNMRTFEAAGARSLLVTGPALKLEDVLPPDSFVRVDGEDPTSWVRAIDGALRHADSQARADLAHCHVLSQHTYDNRAETALTVLAGTTQRRLSRRHRAAALGAAYARWGRLDSLTALPLGPADRWRRGAEAMAWRGLIAANRYRRRLRSLSGSGR